MSQSRRREAILKILEHGPVESQDSLMKSLASFGIRASQATLSRDLREMGIVKSAMGYIHEPSYLYLPTPSARLADTLQRDVFEIKVAHSLVVLRTRPGAAQAVGAVFDAHLPPGVAGTLAGDDTIFLAVDLNADIQGVANEMRELAGLADNEPEVESEGADESEEVTS
ncbi:MAG: arginine repressor [Phycisphaerales bacterium JB061]|jgi:transcriptional regulator of arginine metabolism